MDLDKIYYDLDGNKTNILALVKQCPEWAASRIQHMEKELENCVPLVILKSTIARLILGEITRQRRRTP